MKIQRRKFIKSALIAGSGILLTPKGLASNLDIEEAFPLVDLHVHTTEKFTIDHLMQISRDKNVKFGVLEHPAEWAIRNDNDLRKYIDNLKKYPVYIGLQPLTLGWSSAFSPELLRELDYILMDPQTVPTGNGDFWRIWEFDTYISDTEDFMTRYMQHTMNILLHEPINIFGWPLFLPVCIARDYYKLWTNERMQMILTAARAKNIAIEINDMSHTPHEDFIMMAKEQGLRFTFGSDSRTPNAGKLDFCKEIARRCGLKTDDFFVPPARK